MRRVVDDGETFAAALHAACKCTELKQLYFTTPLALEGRRGGGKGSSSGRDGKRKRDEDLTVTERNQKAQIKSLQKALQNAKAGNKQWGAPPPQLAVGDEAKGGNKGSKKKRNSKLLRLAQDGTEICFNYDSGNCTNEKCQRTHACRKCGQRGNTSKQCQS